MQFWRKRVAQRIWSMSYAAIASGLVGCSVVESTWLGTSGQGQPECATEAGSYYLARSYVTAEIRQQTNGVSLHISGPIHKADANLGFCFDVRMSGTSDDAITVNRSASGLLTSVTSNTLDKSTDIATTLVKTLFVVATQDPRDKTTSDLMRARSALNVGEDKTLLKVTYDPADVAQAGRINTRLAADFGYCLVLDGKTGGLRHEDYCKLLAKGVAGLKEVPYEEPRLHRGREFRSVDGVVYRPMIPVRLYVYARPNRLANEWRLYAFKEVEIAQLSPVLQVGVNRSSFAKHNTTLLFKDGALYDAKVEKDSELLGISLLLVDTVNLITSIPGQIIKVRISQTNNLSKLTEVNTQLIDQQIKLMQAETAHKAALAGNPNVRLPGRSGLDVAALPEQGPSRSSPACEACVFKKGSEQCTIECAQ